MPRGGGGTSFFIVLDGSCLLNERQVHHLEGRNGTDGLKRLVDRRRGRAFGYLPLVFGEQKYDYAARVVEPSGCCVLLVPKADYVHILRREVEKAMKDTVALLKANKTFADWSTFALHRLYFWFTRRRYAPGEDIVRQGAPADFCFVIRSGSCDVLVAQDDKTAASASRARAPPAAVAVQSRRASSAEPGASSSWGERRHARQLRDARRSAGGVEPQRRPPPHPTTTTTTTTTMAAAARRGGAGGGAGGAPAGRAAAAHGTEPGARRDQDRPAAPRGERAARSSARWRSSRANSKRNATVRTQGIVECRSRQEVVPRPRPVDARHHLGGGALPHRLRQGARAAQPKRHEVLMARTAHCARPAGS